VGNKLFASLGSWQHFNLMLESWLDFEKIRYIRVKRLSLLARQPGTGVLGALTMKVNANHCCQGKNGASLVYDGRLNDEISQRDVGNKLFASLGSWQHFNLMLESWLDFGKIPSQEVELDGPAAGAWRARRLDYESQCKSLLPGKKWRKSCL
jgi:hypothetical protein